MIGPRLRHDGQLFWAFDEDPITAAWEATRHLPRGATIRTEMDLPDWWWQGTGFTDGTDNELCLHQTARGPMVALGAVTDDDLDAWCNRADDVDAETVDRINAARDETLREADVPMGAYVTPGRHEAVLAQRMQLPPGTVRTWTRIGAGAAPSEFQRLQEADGAYHVVMVEGTVGIWAGPSPPRVGQEVRPALRRLLFQQGAWRYGIKYLPAD